MADVTIHIEPGAAHLLLTGVLAERCTDSTEGVEDTSQNIEAATSLNSEVAGRVLGCQLANRYASPVTNAVKRERIGCSGISAPGRQTRPGTCTGAVLAAAVRFGRRSKL